jgi:uncharacterized protein
MTASWITAGLSGLFLLVLSGWVIAGRVKFRVGLGDGGNEQMRQRIRAHANFVEYVPFALILIVLVESSGIGAGWLPGVLGGALILGRLIHAQGILKKSGTSAGRFIGTNLTGLVILAGSAAVLGRGLSIW